MSFEPKIVGFLCNWCSYAGCDLAGISRKKYSPNVRVVRVMCTGRVEPTFILKALEAGADWLHTPLCFNTLHFPLKLDNQMSFLKLLGDT